MDSRKKLSSAARDEGYKETEQQEDWTEMDDIGYTLNGI